MATHDELEAAQKAIVAALAQHQSYSHRASSAVVNQINREIDKIGRELWANLSELLEALTPAELQAFTAGRYTTPALRELRDAINDAASNLNEAISGTFAATGAQWAAYEASYVASVMQEVIERLPKVKPDGEKLLKSAMRKPAVGGQLITEMLDRIPEGTRDRVYSSIRQGISEGLTNDQIIKTMRGTKALNYEDGLLQTTKVDAERVVRTARTHISTNSYLNTFKELGVTHVVWCSTLDGRTSKICSVRDGQTWPIDSDFPKPPAHYNCRSTLAPSFDGDLIGNRPYVRSLKVKGRDGVSKFRAIGDMSKKQRADAGLEVGQVKATTNYSTWFKNQDAAFQQEWLGPTRYKLYKQGKYDLIRFVDPQTGKQYTIDELKARDAETFKQIFGE